MMSEDKAPDTIVLNDTDTAVILPREEYNALIETSTLCGVLCELLKSDEGWYVNGSAVRQIVKIMSEGFEEG